MSDDVHSLSGAYAINALDPEERERFEAHLSQCQACQEEVDSLREAATALSALAAEEPPQSLRSEVRELISTVRPEPPSPVLPESHRRRPRIARRRWAWASAAAAAIIAVIGIGIAAPWQDDSPERLTVAEQIAEASDAQHTSIELDGGGTATIIRSASVGRAVIETEEMPPPPAGRHYVLWLQDADGEMHHAGTMTDDTSSTTVLHGDAREATGAGITVEQDPETPQPTTDPVALFAFT